MVFTVCTLSLNCTCYEVDDRSSVSKADRDFWDFFLSHHVQTGSGAHQASYPMGTGRALSPEIKRLERETDNFLPSIKGKGKVVPVL
jgi:hypothetical protein